MSTTNTNVATVGSKSTDTKTAKTVKTQRVLETRDQWAVIFNHCVTLVATLAVGKELPNDARKGFAFLKVAEQPHSRGYAQGLLAGFTGKKAGKVFAKTEGLKDQADRTKIAVQVLLKTKLGGSDENKAKAILCKAEDKQAKAFATAVLEAISLKNDKSAE